MLMMRGCKKLVFVMSLPIFLTITIQAQQDSVQSYKLDSQSRLWLNGHSTVGKFTCGTGLVTGFTLPSSQPNGKAFVSILVKHLDCGNSAMNGDMYSAMKADSFSTITYNLIAVKPTKDSSSISGWHLVDTEGDLTIAGVTKPVEMQVRIRKLSQDKFQIEGAKELSMYDFDITPPSAFWGLIKSNDRLKVNFDLLASPVYDSTTDSISPVKSDPAH
jgi:polyisoprenoid-binding protein YceI